VTNQDSELLDALEECGNGVALVHDDDGHWIVLHNGTQSVVIDGPKPFDTIYWAMEDDIKRARPTAREAIRAWMESDD